MIETQGGLIPLICHLFLIAFTGFFGLSCLFNGKKLSQNFGFRDDQEQVAVAFRPLGFAFTTFSLVLIAQLFQFVITSSFEIYSTLLLFFIFGFVGNLLNYFKIWNMFGVETDVKSIILPLVPIAVILIRCLTSTLY